MTNDQCRMTDRRGAGSWPDTNPCYGANTALMKIFYSNSAKEKEPSLSLASLRQPSRLVLIADAAGTGGVLSGDFRLNGNAFKDNGFSAGLSSVALSFPAPRHPPPKGQSYSGGSFHAAFADGHVERVSTSDARLVTSEGRGAMFTNE